MNDRAKQLNMPKNYGVTIFDTHGINIVDSKILYIKQQRRLTVMGLNPVAGILDGSGVKAT